MKSHFICHIAMESQGTGKAATKKPKRYQEKEIIKIRAQINTTENK